MFAAVNLGYAIVGILGTVLVMKCGRDWLSYIISFTSLIWYFFWWRFVEESLHPNRPKRDVSILCMASITIQNKKMNLCYRFLTTVAQKNKKNKFAKSAQRKGNIILISVERRMDF